MKSLLGFVNNSPELKTQEHPPRFSPFLQCQPGTCVLGQEGTSVPSAKATQPWDRATLQLAQEA